MVLFGHNSWGLPVGKAPNVAVDLGRLVSRATEFTPRELNEMGWAVGQMCRLGFLNAASVGFLPIKWMRNEERGGYAIDFVEQELLEFSIVPVPANPEALIGAKSAGIPIDWVPGYFEEARGNAKAEGDFASPELEYLERMRRLGISAKFFQVPGTKDDAPPDDDAKAQTSAVLKAAPAPALTATDIAAEVRRQLSAVTGS